MGEPASHFVISPVEGLDKRSQRVTPTTLTGSATCAVNVIEEGCGQFPQRKTLLETETWIKPTYCGVSRELPPLVEMAIDVVEVEEGAGVSVKLSAPSSVGVSVKVGVGCVAVTVGVSVGVTNAVAVGGEAGTGVAGGIKSCVTSDTEQANTIRANAQIDTIFFTAHLRQSGFDFHNCTTKRVRIRVGEWQGIHFSPSFREYL